MPDGPKLSVKSNKAADLRIWLQNFTTIFCIFSALEADGFGDRPYFKAFVAETKDDKNQNQIVGFTLYFFTYSTWEGKSLFMEDIYVQQQHRKKGVGLSLFQSVAQVSVALFRALNCNTKFYKIIANFNLGGAM